MADDTGDKETDEEKEERKRKQQQGVPSVAPSAPVAAVPVALPPVTPPVVPVAVPNPLTVGSTFDVRGANMNAAEAYRNLPDTATPAERAQVLADYKATVAYKPPVTVTAENLAAAPFSPDATNRDWMPSVAKYSGWVNAPGSLNEQAQAQALANQNIRTYHRAIQNAQALEQDTTDIHGRRQKPSEGALAAAMALRQNAVKEGLSSGYLSPGNMGDPNIDRARVEALKQIAQARLARDQSTLTELAKPKPEPEKKASGEEGGDLDAQIERNRQRAEAWMAELARKRAIAAGSLGAAYS